MNASQRRSANDRQLQTFFGGYEPTWRLSKLLSIRFVLESRPALQSYLQSYYAPTPLVDEHYLYKAFTNGSLFSAIAELLMQIEDLFALIKFIRDRERFIQRIGSYSAGKVLQCAEALEKSSTAEILALFLLPQVSYLDDLLARSPDSAAQKSEARANFLFGVQRLESYLKDVLAEFRRRDFFYNQYKHGLTVALWPFGRTLPQSTIDQRKQDFVGFPVCCDNDLISVAFRDGRIGQTAMIIPDISDPVRLYLSELEKDRNLLRYSGPDEVDLASLIDVCRKACQLVLCIMKNRLELITPSQTAGPTVYLPGEATHGPLGLTATTFVAGPPLKLEDFPENL